MPIVPADVRSSGETGNHMLVLRLTGCDPNQSLARPADGWAEGQ